MKKGIIFFAIGMMFLSSCSKSKQEILTSTTWMIESITALRQSMVQDCMKDDYFYFTSGGKVEWYQNGTTCTQSSLLTFTPDFVLSSDEKTLSLTLDVPVLGKQKIDMTVEELTETRMRATASSPIAISAVFVAKK